MDEIFKTMRDNLYEQVNDILQRGESVDVSTMSLYVQLKTLDLLISVDSHLDDHFCTPPRANSALHLFSLALDGCNCNQVVAYYLLVYRPQ